MGAESNVQTKFIVITERKPAAVDPNHYRKIGSSSSVLWCINIKVKAVLITKELSEDLRRVSEALARGTQGEAKWRFANRSELRANVAVFETVTDLGPRLDWLRGSESILSNRRSCKRNSLPHSNPLFHVAVHRARRRLNEVGIGEGKRNKEQKMHRTLREK
jgi:hypothetical protein